jgi:hypothetical protein
VYRNATGAGDVAWGQSTYLPCTRPWVQFPAEGREGKRRRGGKGREKKERRKERERKKEKKERDRKKEKGKEGRKEMGRGMEGTGVGPFCPSTSCHVRTECPFQRTQQYDASWKQREWPLTRH